MHGAIADFYRGPFLMVPPGEESVCGGKLAMPLVTMASRFFTNSSSRSAANVAGAVVVIIGKDAAYFSVLLNPRGPVVLMPFLEPFLLYS